MASGFTLRPLSVGEIFDRALTVYVKNWPPFTILSTALVAAYIPVTYATGSVVATYDLHPASNGTQQPMLAAILAVMGGDPKHQNLPLLWSDAAVSLLVMALVYPAFGVGYLQIIRGDSASLSGWVGATFARVGRLLGLFLLWVLAFIGGATVVGLVLVVIALFLVRNTPLFIGTVLVLMVPFIALVVAVSITAAWSGFIAVIENRRITDSFRSAQRRSLGSGRFWRTVGIGAALTVLGLTVGYAFQATAASVLVLSKSPALYSVVTALLSIPLGAFGPIVIATYYVDSRVRDGELGQSADASTEG